MAAIEECSLNRLIGLTLGIWSIYDLYYGVEAGVESIEERLHDPSGLEGKASFLYLIQNGPNCSELIKQRNKLFR